MRRLLIIAAAVTVSILSTIPGASARIGMAPLAAGDDAVIQVRGHGHGGGHGHWRHGGRGHHYGWHRGRGHHYGWHRGRGHHYGWHRGHHRRWH